VAAGFLHGHARRVDGLHRSKGVPFNAGNLDKTTYGIAGHSKVMLHGNFRSVLDLFVNQGDRNPTVLLTSSVVVGGDGHVTPTGTFTATVWEKDHVSTKYGNAADTPWSKTALGGNAFGPYQLHMKELDSQGIYIHGTMGPGWSPVTWGNSIFLSPTSHGCVRMCNRDDIALRDMMPNPSGNKVIIRTQQEPED
jgi:hypothetical protein